MLRISYEYALLSEASYTDLEGIRDSDDLKTALVNLNSIVDEDKGFSQIQAEDFVRHWRVAHHLPNTSTGFSATVFERVHNPGEFVFAMRGTEPTAQLGIDLTLADIADIGADGIALNQAIDLFNYYQRLITPEDQLAHQYDLYEDTEPPPEGLEYIEYEDGIPFTGTHYRYLVPAEPMQGLDIIPDTVATIDTTGHSLGGHLALILSRLDPNRVGEVLTYNALGFDTGIIGSDDTEWFFRAMVQIDINQMGMTTVGQFPVNIIDNLVAAQDTISRTGHLPGNITPFDNEGENWQSAHSMQNVTDVLAVCNLFSALDPNADLTEDITPICMAASWKADHSLEEWARSLSRLLGVSELLPAIDDREALYQAIYAIEAELFIDRTTDNPQLKLSYQNLEVESLVDLTPEQIVANKNNNPELTANWRDAA
ncbi:MAG: hypothetical protein KUF72_06575 [Candidatus Thiodiazotropha sp. (ex Ctena orbiculata)]|nr:hypothetical protein [Candidatus Thiodiazotropha taylori]